MVLSASGRRNAGPAYLEDSLVSSALMATYRRFDVAFERGEGPYLYTAEGKRYLDFAAGIAVAAFGHCHPHLTAALKHQADHLWHCSNLYRIPGQERLARRLADATFADQAFFCNSGAEAIECGLKLVRRYHDVTGHPERYRVITFAGAFHGRTLATIAAGGSPRHLEGFDPVIDGFDQVEYDDLGGVRAAVSERTAAILVEPIQGEGGLRAASTGFLRGLREIADERGLLLFFDEIQCGMGRSGRFSCHEWAGITPDLMAVAKGLGGGFPVGACLATAEAAKGLGPGSHGSTFGGNPLAMAVGNAALDVLLADGFLAHVNAVGERLRNGLAGLTRSYPGLIVEIRGRGLMLGIKCTIEAREWVGQLLAEGLLTVPAADNVVRLVPPLIIDDACVDEALAILDRSCARLSEKAA
jgi:acetylornithine/N-succinyldiaminopimelate aminotransferase